MSIGYNVPVGEGMDRADDSKTYDAGVGIAEQEVDGDEGNIWRERRVGHGGRVIAFINPRTRRLDASELASKPGTGKPTMVFHKAEEAEPDALPVEDTLPDDELDYIVTAEFGRIYRDAMDVEPLQHQGGGFGRSYLGHTTARTYFVKAIKRGQPNEILDEATIHHEVSLLTDVVPQIYFTTATPAKGRTLPIIGMEAIEGKNLLEYLADSPLRGRERSKYILETFERIVRAVGQIHGAGYVHRDLKPQNILIEKDGRVRIIDLGIAAKIGEEPSNRGPSGTPAYMSPEHHLNGPAQTTMDMYSLGCILYQLVTGKTPLERLEEKMYNPDGSINENLGQFVNAKIGDEHLKNPPARIKKLLDDADRNIVEVLKHTVRANPAERYHSCKALANAVRNIINKMDRADEMSRQLREALTVGRIIGAYSDPKTAVTTGTGWSYEEGQIIDELFANVHLGPPA